MAQGIEGIVADGGAAGLTDPVLTGGKDDSADLHATRMDPTGRTVTIGNASAELVSSTHGPSTFTLADGLNQILVAAPGVGNSVYVSTLQISMALKASTIVEFKPDTLGLPRVRYGTDGERVEPAINFDPPWKLPENTPLVAQRISGNRDVYINYNFYVEAT